MVEQLHIDGEDDEKKTVGDAAGGADSSGPGNILGGVQPGTEAASNDERRDTPTSSPEQDENAERS